MTPRGLRNNNPLNIRKSRDVFQGEVKNSTDREFKQFTSMPYGYRAAFKMLYNYQHLYGCQRLADFINRWAPPIENDTLAYIRTVCKYSGLANMSDLTTVDTTDKTMMCGIVAGMSFHENGIVADMDFVHAGWELFAQELKR